MVIYTCCNCSRKIPYEKLVNENNDRFCFRTLNLDTFTNTIKHAILCPNCSAALFLDAENKLRQLDHYCCRIFNNVEYCNKTAREQEEMASTLRCHVTGKPLKLKNSMFYSGAARLIGYDSRNEKQGKLFIVSHEGMKKLQQCSRCGMTDLEGTNQKFHAYYTENNTLKYACTHCHNKVNDNKFFGFKFRPFKGRGMVKNPFSRLVGIELETIGGVHFGYFDLPEQLRGAVSARYDGSLYTSNRYGEEDDPDSPVNSCRYAQETDQDCRGAGREYALIPVAKDKLFSMIDDLCYFLHSKECQINKSCGFHCHFDMKKENYNTVRKTFLVFSVFENVLFDMLPSTRRKNKYCLPLKKNYKEFFNIHASSPQEAFEQYWFNTRSPRDIKHQKAEKYNKTRYVSINYHALFFHGTLENRMHSGTINPEKIKKWVLLNHVLIEFAKATPVKDIIKLTGDIQSLLKIVLFYERRIPVLARYKLGDYIIQRTNRFRSKDCPPIKIINDLESTSVEREMGSDAFRLVFGDYKAEPKKRAKKKTRRKRIPLLNERVGNERYVLMPEDFSFATNSSSSMRG